MLWLIAVLAWYALAYVAVVILSRKGWLILENNPQNADDHIGNAIGRFFAWLLSPVAVPVVLILIVMWYMFGKWVMPTKEGG